MEVWDSLTRFRSISIAVIVASKAIQDIYDLSQG